MNEFLTDLQDIRRRARKNIDKGAVTTGNKADVRPLIADECKTAQFLASKGVVLNTEAQAAFLDCGLDELIAAILLLVEGLLVDRYRADLALGAIQGDVDINRLIMRVVYLWLIVINKTINLLFGIYVSPSRYCLWCFLDETH